jgi:glycosyltransferase involved in cell wall biosynthesis
MQFGSTDVMGTRFNGQDLHKQFVQRGIASQHLVWEKRGKDPDTYEMTHSRIYRKLNVWINRLERTLSLQSILHPSIFPLMLRPNFWQADIVHYHLIHTGYFSLTNLPLLSRIKPAVWTLHDPWAMTGHCVHPYECEKWKTGCGNCPTLNIDFAMKRDNTALMWKMKNWLYAASKIDVIVASKWMLNMAKQSPLMSNFEIHHIPFGVDLNVFKPGDTEKKKKKLGIPPGNIVISVRSTLSKFKGVTYLLEALEMFKPKVPITLLTFNEKGHFDRFLGKYQIIELGWIENQQKTIDAYQASDFFVMPSIAEAFGMMAMEAMACGKPVIVFDGTSLSETVFAPEGGLSVQQKNSAALADALYKMLDPERRLEMGMRARELAVQHYNMDTHTDKVLEIYRKVLQKGHKEKNDFKINHNDIFDNQ